MNYLSPTKTTASKEALDESALKRVVLCPNLGNRKANERRTKPRRDFGIIINERNMISAAQLRAARGLLDWTRADLAKAANISPETVKNIEHGTFKPQENTAEAIIQAFRARDVEFIEDDGVRVRKDSVIRFEGREGFKRFVDDVYQTSSTIGSDKEGCLSASDDGLFSKFLGDYFEVHARRMNSLQNVKIKVLIKEKPLFNLPEETPENSYRVYRWFSQSNVGNVPFYVYGDKLGIMIFEEDDVNVFVISSAPVAKAYREQFDVLWQSAKPLERNLDPRLGKKAVEVLK